MKVMALTPMATRFSPTFPLLLRFMMMFVMATALGFSQADYRLQSPNQKITVVVSAGERLTYDVLLGETVLLQKCSLALDVDHHLLGQSPRVVSAKRNAEDNVLEPPIKRKSATIHEHYNQLRLVLADGLAVSFRAYDEGVAYRLETSAPEKEVKVYKEEVNFHFPADFPVWYPQEDSMMSHNERVWLPRKLSEIPTDSLATMPALVDAGVAKIAIAESDVEEYPGLWFHGSSGPALVGIFPHYPLKEELHRDRDLMVTESADYIAVTSGTRTYPWRIMGIAEKDGDLITSQLVWLLAKPSQLTDTSWIKPGKVAWDWWNFNNIYGVDFKAGVNTETYKYYIDFASKYGLQYIVLDEGWYKLGDVMDVAPEINIPELTAYAKTKNVGVILWVVWKSLDDKLIPALDQWQKWDVKGIKVDFMQRDDQLLINYYHRVSRETAKRHMMVDFHGAQRSATMTRTWPNLISNEGVRGLEWSKWSADANPRHNLTLPFTRMFLGPMDYTPGAMLNATREDFAATFNRPMALGTRCHQLAMYVVFESPLQMLADSPSNYYREPEAMEFLAPVPTVWDETRILDAKMGEFVLLARRSGKDWYVGAMTNWTARDLDVDLSFLGAGKHHMLAYRDGVNADRYAGDYKQTKSEISGSEKFTIHLAPGGGFAARIQP